MGNRWKEVWNKDRDFVLSRIGEDEFDVYRELKRLDGFDVSIEDAEPIIGRFMRRRLQLGIRYGRQWVSVLLMKWDAGAGQIYICCKIRELK